MAGNDTPNAAIRTEGTEKHDDGHDGHDCHAADDLPAADSAADDIKALAHHLFK